MVMDYRQGVVKIKNSMVHITQDLDKFKPLNSVIPYFGCSYCVRMIVWRCLCPYVDAKIRKSDLSVRTCEGLGDLLYSVLQNPLDAVIVLGVPINLTCN